MIHKFIVHLRIYFLWGLKHKLSISISILFSTFTRIFQIFLFYILFQKLNLITIFYIKMSHRRINWIAICPWATAENFPDEESHSLEKQKVLHHLFSVVFNFVSLSTQLSLFTTVMNIFFLIVGEQLLFCRLLFSSEAHVTA